MIGGWFTARLWIITVKWIPYTCMKWECNHGSRSKIFEQIVAQLIGTTDCNHMACVRVCIRILLGSTTFHGRIYNHQRFSLNKGTIWWYGNPEFHAKQITGKMSEKCETRVASNFSNTNTVRDSIVSGSLFLVPWILSQNGISTTHYKNRHSRQIVRLIVISTYQKVPVIKRPTAEIFVILFVLDTHQWHSWGRKIRRQVSRATNLMFSYNRS